MNLNPEQVLEIKKKRFIANPEILYEKRTINLFVNVFCVVWEKRRESEVVAEHEVRILPIEYVL